LKLEKDAGIVLHGGAGSDKVAGHEGADDVYGDDGKDRAYLEARDDYGSGGAGVDTIVFFRAPVTANLLTGVASGEGSDTFTGFENATGSRWNDTLTGSAGANVLTGGGGGDYLYGRGGKDRLYGTDGNDYLDGGPARDRLDGGAGIDTCVDGSGGAARYACE
jgi:Ca2+-binding RTX toxin-like protein